MMLYKSITPLRLGSSSAFDHPTGQLDVEDALSAVPRSLQEASYGLGARSSKRR
jgi:hypothetical protein